jgi:hypothetical protein
MRESTNMTRPNAGTSGGSAPRSPAFVASGQQHGRGNALRSHSSWAVWSCECPGALDAACGRNPKSNNRKKRKTDEKRGDRRTCRVLVLSFAFFRFFRLHCPSSFQPSNQPKSLIPDGSTCKHAFRRARARDSLKVRSPKCVPITTATSGNRFFPLLCCWPKAENAGGSGAEPLRSTADLQPTCVVDSVAWRGSHASEGR